MIYRKRIFAAAILPAMTAYLLAASLNQFSAEPMKQKDSSCICEAQTSSGSVSGKIRLELRFHAAAEVWELSLPSRHFSCGSIIETVHLSSKFPAWSRGVFT